MTKSARITIFLSGSGSNAETIIQHFKKHASIEVALVLSNNPNAGGLEKAEKLSVPTNVFTKNQWISSEEVLDWLQQANTSHIVLAGFLWLIPNYLIKAFANRIINIHPSLLPRYGGRGMYGMKVHEAVKAAGETETGITIHEVTEQYDEGRILFQGKCPIHPSYTTEQISREVQRLEHAHYPRVIEQWVKATLSS